MGFASLLNDAEDFCAGWQPELAWLAFACASSSRLDLLSEQSCGAFIQYPWRAGARRLADVIDKFEVCHAR